MRMVSAAAQLFFANMGNTVEIVQGTRIPY